MASLKLQDATVEAERLGELFIINREQVRRRAKEKSHGASPRLLRVLAALETPLDADGKRGRRRPTQTLAPRPSHPSHPSSQD